MFPTRKQNSLFYPWQVALKPPPDNLIGLDSGKNNLDQVIPGLGTSLFWPQPAADSNGFTADQRRRRYRCPGPLFLEKHDLLDVRHTPGDATLGDTSMVICGSNGVEKIGGMDSAGSILDARMVTLLKRRNNYTELMLFVRKLKLYKASGVDNTTITLFRWRYMPRTVQNFILISCDKETACCGCGSLLCCSY